MEWIKRWGYSISTHPVKPCIWKLETGGYLLRIQVRDLRKKKRTVQRVLHDATMAQAQAALHVLRSDASRTLRSERPTTMLFAVYAVDLLERKLRAGDIKSAKGEEKWRDVLDLHLVPTFGMSECGELRYAHGVDWRDAMARQIKKERLAPSTANTRIGILKVISKAMTAELELEKDPFAGLQNFDLSDRPTHTDESPNALPPERVGDFLRSMQEHWPQFYAMTFLGVTTGLRPSSLRPLRRRGPEPDIDLERGILRVRRSNSLGQKVMNRTKTGKNQIIPLADEQIAVLKAHIETLDEQPEKEGLKHRKMRESPYLFPSVRGGMRARSVLDNPFEDVRKRIGVPFHISPKAMRRTFQDLCRAAEIHDVVVRSISGHATKKMQEHYSTAQMEERRGAVAKVVRLFEKARTG